MFDSKKSIVKSASRFLSGTLLSRMSGLARDVTLAYAFGTQGAVGALLVAFRFAHLLRRLLGEGAMQTAFIPHFEELRKKSSYRAGKFFCDLTLTLSGVLGIFIFLVMSALTISLQLELFNPGNSEIVWLTLLMLPSLFFICLFGINASLLQCEKSYFISSSAPILFNLMWIIGILFTQNMPITQAMSWLSLFVILACMAQWIVTIPKTLSVLRSYGISRFFDQIKWKSPDVWDLVKPLSLGIIGIAASQFNNALDAIFARWTNDEGPAILWYAIRIQQLPLALFGIALSGAVLPPLSRAIKSGNYPQFSHFLDFAFNSTLTLIIPLTIALFVMGERCVAIIYGHGDFTQVSVATTTMALWGYTLGLIPMALILILSPAYYTQKNYRIPSIAGVSSVILNICLNFLFVTYTTWEATGIAIATSISAWFNLIWLQIYLPSILPKNCSLNWKNWLWNGAKITLGSFLAALAIFSIDAHLWKYFNSFIILHEHFPPAFLSFNDRILQLGCNGLIFIGILCIFYKYGRTNLTSKKGKHNKT